MEIHEKIGFGVAIIIIALLAKQDIYERKISLFTIIISGCIALLYLAAGEKLDIVSLCLRILPGVVLLFVSLLSDEKVGYGDGASVLMLGLWTSAAFCMLATTIGMLLAGIYGLVLLITSKKEQQIPFLPFLLTAMEVLLVYV